MIGDNGPGQQGDKGQSSAPALIMAIAALIGALTSFYIAVQARKEPDAGKISAGSEEISHRLQAEHDQVVALVQAVADLSKNANQNHMDIESIRSEFYTKLADARRSYAASGNSNSAPSPVTGGAPQPPAMTPLKPVAIPKQLPKPPAWSATTKSLEPAQ